MTEQPDTAAIRAASRGNTYRYLAGIVTVLCDALDAARAERDALAAIVDMAGEWPKAMARAEAAEAQVREDVLALDEAYAMLRTALARAKVAEGTGR